MLQIGILWIFTIFAALLNIGPIVQWIEYQIPVLTIWVRLPVGSQSSLITINGVHTRTPFVFANIAIKRSEKGYCFSNRTRSSAFSRLR